MKKIYECSRAKMMYNIVPLAMRDSPLMQTNKGWL